MRLAILTTSYPRSDGDSAGAFVRTFALEASALGHEVEVVALGMPSSDAITRNEVPVFWVRAGAPLVDRGGIPERLSEGGRAWIDALLASAGLLIAARQRVALADAVISSWLLPAGLVGELVACRRPHLAIAHSGDVHLALRLGLGRPLARLLARSPATRLAFSCQALLDKFTQPLGPRLGEVVRRRTMVRSMGVPREIGPATVAARAAARTALGLPATTLPGRIVLLSLGRLVPIKGIDVLLTAARVVRGQGLEPTLLIAGDGPLATELAARARRELIDARFLGAVSGEAKSKALAAADVFCLPSRELSDGRSEGAPVALLEALAAGLPAIASSTGGVAELVSDGESGLLVPPDEPAALAKALLRLNDPSLRARLAGSALRASVAHRPEVVAQALLSHLVAPASSTP